MCALDSDGGISDCVGYFDPDFINSKKECHKMAVPQILIIFNLLKFIQKFLACKHLKVRNCTLTVFIEVHTIFCTCSEMQPRNSLTFPYKTIP